MPLAIVMEVMEKAASMERAGEKIIHLESGESLTLTLRNASRRRRSGPSGKEKPTIPTAWEWVESGEAIAEHYFTEYKVRISPDQILITSGTSPGMLLLFMSLLEPGDEVILPNPYYACYPNFVRMAEGTPIFVKVREEEGFQYRPEEIKLLMGSKTKAIFLNSPANPTGNLTPPERMKAIADLDRMIVSDEDLSRSGLRGEGALHSRIYPQGRGDQRVFQALRHDRVAPRIPDRPSGVCPSPAEDAPEFLHLGQRIRSMGWYRRPKESAADTARMKEIYNTRRKFIIRKLRELGFGITVEPTGAFYILANAKKFTQNSFEFAFDILKNAKVGCTPGIDFGSNAEGYLRFSYANSVENIEEAMNRLGRYLQEKFPEKRS